MAAERFKSYPLKLAPRFVPRLWGGDSLPAFHRLAAASSPGSPGSVSAGPTPIGESWLLGDENVVSNGPLAGVKVAELAQRYGAELLGTANTDRYGHKLALLAKFLDAEQDLSLQVHPGDAYALANESATGHLGKAEAWYVLAAEPGAVVLWGFAREVTASEVRAAIGNGDLEALLNRLPVAAGDVIVNPAGTVHAVGAGVMLFEIQQSSDLTYRLYDYDRRDAAGRPRELHVDKALAVADLGRSDPSVMLGRTAAAAPNTASGTDKHREGSEHSTTRWRRLVALPEFVMDVARLDGQELTASTTARSLELVVHTSGELTLTSGREGPDEQSEPVTMGRGDAVLLPANLGSYRLAGSGELIRCAIGS